MDITFSQLENMLLAAIGEGGHSTRKLFEMFVTRGEYSKAGFYKALGILCRDGVVFKAGDVVSINQLWASQAAEFFTRLAQEHDDKYFETTLTSLKTGDKITYHFSLLKSVDVFVLNVLYTLSKNLDVRDVHIKQPFEIFLILDQARTEQILKLFTDASRRVYVISSGGTQDLELFRRHKSRTLHTHVISPKRSPVKILHTVGDFVLELSLDKRMVAQATKVYVDKTASVAEQRAHLNILFTQKGKYTIAIYRNDKKAKSVRKEFSKYFLLH